MKKPKLTVSIVFKLMFIILTLSIVPLILSSILTYKNSLQIISNDSIISNQRILEQGSQNITNYFKNLNETTLSLYKDRQFITNLYSLDGEFFKSSYNENVLKSILFSNEDFRYLYFYVPISQLLYSFSTETASKDNYPAIEKEQWFNNTLQSANGFYIEPTHKFINYNKIGSMSDDEVFSINRTVIDIATGRSIALLSISIRLNTLKQLTASMGNTVENMILVTKDDAILCANGDSNQLRSLLLTDQINHTQSGFYKTADKNGIYLVIYQHTFDGMILAKIISSDTFAEHARQAVYSNIRIGFFTILLVLSLSIILALWINNVLKRLQRVVRAYGRGNFDVQMDYQAKDEFGEFVANFNDMASKIKSMVNSEYKAKIVLKNTQILALQTQINPHFLYNTLQSISSLSLSKDQEDIYRMVDSLSSLLKYSLGNSNELVDLNTELEYTKSYLYILKVRFNTTIEAIIEVAPDLLNIKVPRLIFQPLVENSIKYGYKDGKNSPNRFGIKAWREEDKMYIDVWDDGDGIEPHILNMINKWIDTEQFMLDYDDHIGLRNVISRIKLIYAEHSDIRVKSVLGKGTSVTIIIPIT